MNVLKDIPNLTMTTILIVEDEPLLGRAYENILKEIQSEAQGDPFKITTCKSYPSAIAFLAYCEEHLKTIDVCLLDYRLDIKNDTDSNGLIIGQRIRTSHPNCKIVVITSIGDHYLWHQILEDLNPSGFLIKSDTEYEILKKNLILLLSGSRVYSKKINDFIFQ